MAVLVTLFQLPESIDVPSLMKITRRCGVGSDMIKYVIDLT